MAGYACDISESGLLRIAGADALGFITTMCSCPSSPLGQLFKVSQGLLLTSQGEVIDVAQVVCTGSDEYLVLLSPENAGT